jgi:GT2 family glycosyltransferase/glycosyltransferase involved in cell wall biosynthesis
MTAEMVSPPSPLAAPARASVLIAVWNKLELTRRCLDVLLEQRSPLLHEIVVVDNGSTDGTAEYLAELAAREPLVTVVSPGENLGFVGGNNVAAGHATGDYLVFLNNDTEPREGWLEALVETAEGDAAVGAVGAKLIYPDGRLQEAGGIVFADASGWNYGRGGDPDDPRYTFVRDVDYCSGAALLVRTSLFRQLGGFDTLYAPAYYEDTDLCFALRDLGHRVVYQPASEVVHHEGATAGTDLAEGMKRYQEVNRHSFRAKWADALRTQSQPHPALVRRASDRAPGKRVLVVDPLMPAYDRASGSKRLFELLRMLSGAGHAVTFIARNGAGGERYKAELERLGVEVYAGDPAKVIQSPPARPFELPSLLTETGYDLALLSFYYVAEQYLPEIRSYSPHTRIAIDTVDVHWVREEREAELYGDAARTQQAAVTKRRELGVYAYADALVAVTEDDRQALLAQLPDVHVHVVPNVHDTVGAGPGFEERDGLLFVGNFNHPPNGDAALWLCEEILPRVRAELPGVRATIVGQNPPAEVAAHAGEAVHVTGWVPETEPYVSSHRVSVAPLRYGAGMKGKIGEALAAGLPVVTTPTGAEGMGEAPLLVADDADAFAAEIVRVYRDRSLWERLAASSRDIVEQRWSPRAVASTVESLVAYEAERAVDAELTSIIVLVHDQAELTERCLRSIDEHTPERHELILVDNGSGDQASGLLRRWVNERENVVLVRNGDNRGFAGGNNQGLALARGGRIVLLNNDTEVTPGWLERMHGVLDRHPETGIVGATSNRAAGPQQVEDADYEPGGHVEFAARVAERNDGRSETSDRLVGFCLLLRRDVVDRIGGLDERFGFGNFEDDDYILRARLEGWDARVALDSFVHHVGNQTFQAAGIEYQQQILQNWQIFKEKWAIPADSSLADGYEISEEASGAVARLFPLLPVGLDHEWSGRVWEETQEARRFAAAVQGVRTGGPARLRNAFAEAANWRDEHRRYQSRAWLVEMVLQSPDRGDDWKRLFAVAADEVLKALEENPAEPVFLNYVGILLYELTGFEGAEALFRAANRLDPDLPHVEQNLKAARHHKGRVRRLPIQGLAELELRAKRVAAAAKPAEGMTVSLCMIVKDEEEMLPGCLEPVHGYVDELIVVDTGSSDRTVEIAESFGAKVIHFPWNGSFSDARNVGLDAATGDWLFYLDADEHMVAEDAPKLRTLLGKTWREGFHLAETNYTGGDESGPAVTHMALRLFRNRPEYRFVGRIHEQKTHAMPTYLSERWEAAPVRVLHYGYLKGRIADKDKSRRNLELLEREAREKPSGFNSYNLGCEYARLGEHEAARGHFENAWKALGDRWADVGYASVLAVRLAVARRATGDVDGAVATIVDGLQAFPDHTDLVLELASCAWAKGDHAEAEKLALRCLELGDAPAEYIATVGAGTYLALHLLGELRREQGDAAGAEAYHRRSLAEFPDYVAPVLPLASAMLARGAASAEVEAIVPEGRPSAMTLVATAFHEAGRVEDAERWFAAALERQPANGLARVGLIEALLSQQRWAEAAAEAEREPADSPFGPAAAGSGLFAHALVGDAAGLAAAVQQAREAGVAAPDLALYSAWTLTLAGEPLPQSLPAEAATTALTVLEALLRIQDFDTFGVVLPLFELVDVDPRERREAIARVYLRRGFVDSAASEWIAVARERPDARAFVGLAQVAFAQGQPDDALAFAEEALALEPGHEEASLVRSNLLARAA